MAFSFFKRNKQEEPTAAAVRQIEVSQIVPNRFQPRQVFNKDAIVELAETIAAHGLLQPIVVREYEPQHFEIIAGERRFRAVSYLHWTTVPAIVKKMSDTESASFAVIENLQREELTAIEEAQAYQRLMKLNQLTQVQLAKALGKSQSFVANKIRLLKLSPAVQRALLNRKLTERHGRCLVALPEEQQVAVLKQIESQHLSVKETEAVVRKLRQPRPRKRVQLHGAIKDVKVVLNTLNKSLKLIEQGGMKLTTKEEEHDDYYRIIVDVPKTAKNNKQANHGTKEGK